MFRVKSPSLLASLVTNLLFHGRIWNKCVTNKIHPPQPSNLLICHLILIYQKKKMGQRMEIVQFYYFWPFSGWTSAIVTPRLHWPHPASAHLLQQGDVYLQQEEIKALLHELQICKSFYSANRLRTVSTGAHWGPADLKSKSRHAEDTHVAPAHAKKEKKKSALWRY